VSKGKNWPRDWQQVQQTNRNERQSGVGCGTSVMWTHTEVSINYFEFCLKGEQRNRMTVTPIITVACFTEPLFCLLGAGIKKAESWV
jgi:hypothetical protein